MDEAQALLYKKFAYIEGFQPVGVIEPGSGGAMVGTPKKQFVQIVNTGQHWICVSNVERPPGEITIFDSLGVGRELGKEISLYYETKQ